jgi:hypothetical protein
VELELGFRVAVVEEAREERTRSVSNMIVVGLRDTVVVAEWRERLRVVAGHYFS